MNRNDFLLACDFMGLRPKKYDSDGWMGIIIKLMNCGVDCSSVNESASTLPKSRKELDDEVAKSKKSMADAINGYLTTVFAINADDFAVANEDVQDKLFKQFLTTCDSMYFPPYCLEMNPVLQNFLQLHVMFTYNKKGEPLIYTHDDSEPGNIWKEAGNHETVFQTMQGGLREQLMAVLCSTSDTATVTVVYEKDGKTDVARHVPKYKLFRRYYGDMIKNVSGTEENIRKFGEYLTRYIDNLKRIHERRFTKGELATGLQLIPKRLAEMDEGINEMGFIYRKSISLPSLTNDPNEPAQAYFDLSTITEGPTPDFDGFLEAVVPECRKSLMAAIFATFFAQSHLNQYIWIHGEGGDGKSSLLNAMAEYAGENLACSLAHNMDSNFALENAIGKRLVIMSDVKTGLSVKSQLIHNLTGHDLIDIDRKNKPVISVHLDPILWIAANEAPDVNFENRNEARRCLYIKMLREPPVEIQRKFYFTDDKGNFMLDANGEKINNGFDLKGALVKEMPHILYKCREVFYEVCRPPYSVIMQSTEQSRLAVVYCTDIDANEWTTYITEAFDFNPEGRLRITDIHENLQATRASHGDKSKLNNFQKRDIIRLLETKFKCKRKKIDGVRYMEGVCSRGASYAPNLPPAPSPVKMPTVGDFV